MALRRTTSTMDSATATSSASRTPTATTPAMVTAAIATSTLLVRARPRQASGFTIPMAAATMTAPRVALGRYCIGSVRNSSTRAMTTAASRPESWVRAPIWSLTAVRDPLAPIGNPWLIPAARLAAPMAPSSVSAPTCSPRWPAKEQAVRISSE